MTVAGRVQGVWFREGVRQLAERHGVAGWVRNEPDGTVGALFEGERDAVARLVDFCRVGPPGARVDRVETTEEEPAGAAGFDVM